MAYRTAISKKSLAWKNASRIERVMRVQSALSSCLNDLPRSLLDDLTEPGVQRAIGGEALQHTHDARGLALERVYLEALMVEALDIAGFEQTRSRSARVRGNDQLVGHGSLSRRTAPNQDVRTEIGSVRPDNRAESHLRGPKDIWLVPNRFEHRPDQERLNIAFDDRPIGQDEAEVEPIERLTLEIRTRPIEEFYSSGAIAPGTRPVRVAFPDDVSKPFQA